jgi:hypothetical protein
MRAARVNPFHPRQQNNIAGQAREAGVGRGGPGETYLLHYVIHVVEEHPNYDQI